MYVTLVPAYRDYKTAKEVKAAWDAQKDFRIECVMHPSDGKLINKQQAQPGDKYSIRYNKLRCSVSVKP